MGLIYWTGGWFGLQGIIPGATVLLSIYFTVSLLMAFFILSKEEKAKVDLNPAELVSSN
jgi:alkylglycerol monooxygenase